MFHAKFHDHRTISSVGKDFRRFLPYMGMAAILVMLPGLYILCFRFPKEAHIKFGFDWPSGLREKDL